MTEQSMTEPTCPYDCPCCAELPEAERLAELLGDPVELPELASGELF